MVRDVGTEGKLGQAAAVTIEVGGVWKDLTDNVNQLAANLTNQVRAISDVATAVTQGDLTRQVGVEANGEVAELKDKLNEMIRNLRETTRQNTEPDWLKTNLERFTRMLPGQRDLATVSDLILSELAPLVAAQHAAFYRAVRQGEKRVLLTEVPTNYVRINSGLGDSTPLNIIVLPSYSRERSAPWSSSPHSHPSAKSTRHSSISSPRASAWC